MKDSKNVSTDRPSKAGRPTPGSVITLVSFPTVGVNPSEWDTTQRRTGTPRCTPECQRSKTRGDGDFVSQTGGRLINRMRSNRDLTDETIGGRREKGSVVEPHQLNKTPELLFLSSRVASETVRVHSSDHRSLSNLTSKTLRQYDIVKTFTYRIPTVGLFSHPKATHTGLDLHS